MKRFIKKWANIPIKEKVFQIINLTLVIGIVCFYFVRMAYWKDELAQDKNSGTQDTLQANVTSLTGVDLSSNDRLFANEDGTYVFKGDCTNNYISYSNHLYRVISVDGDGNIKAICQDCISNSVLYETDGFLTSDLYSWLNADEQIKGSGIYEKTLKYKASTITTVNTDVAVVTNPNSITADLVETNAGLLSVQEYITAGGKNSYLNNGTAFWLSNISDSGKYYFVSEDGEISTSYSDALMFGVRPVINFKYSVIVLSGKGTIDNPYVVNEASDLIVSELSSGSYISYSDYLWRVQYIDENGNAILSMDDYIRTDGEIYTTTFGDENVFVTDSGVGKYLNKTFRNTLVDYQDYLVKNQWDYGEYNVVDHGYLCNYQSTIASYVALPHAGYLYLDKFDDFAFMTSSLNSRKTVYAMKNKILYEYTKDDQIALVPVICLSNTVEIATGSGSESDPYTLRLANNE